MAVLTIIKGEAYTDDNPVYVTVQDADGTAIDLTGCQTWVNIQAITGSVLTLTGSTQGAAEDAPTSGVFHINATEAQTDGLAESVGNDAGQADVKILFSDGAIRYTEPSSCEIKTPLA